jgi:hypothetical protein
MVASDSRVPYSLMMVLLLATGPTIHRGLYAPARRWRYDVADVATRLLDGAGLAT